MGRRRFIFALLGVSERDHVVARRGDYIPLARHRSERSSGEFWIYDEMGHRKWKFHHVGCQAPVFNVGGFDLWWVRDVDSRVHLR